MNLVIIISLVPFKQKKTWYIQNIDWRFCITYWRSVNINQWNAILFYKVWMFLKINLILSGIKKVHKWVQRFRCIFYNFSWEKQPKMFPNLAMNVPYTHLPTLFKLFVCFILNQLVKLYGVLSMPAIKQTVAQLLLFLWSIFNLLMFSPLR